MNLYIQLTLTSFKNAESLSPGEIDEIVSDKETDFLSKCRNAIQLLESSDFMKRIEVSKNAQTAKNKRDAIEFLGKELPDLSVVLQKVFDSPLVQVIENTILLK